MNPGLIVNALPFLLLLALWTGAVLALRYKSVRNAHLERMAAMERGMDIRPLLVEATPAYGHRIFLLRALLWIFGGAALLVVGTVLGHGTALDHGGPPGLVGFIPMSIGIAYLVFYALEERRTRRESKQG